MPVQATCSVTGAGPMADFGGRVIIFLKESPGTNYFQGKTLCFLAFDGFKREMLAVALAAMSTGRQVWVDMGDAINPNVPSGDESGTIRSLYLI